MGQMPLGPEGPIGWKAQYPFTPTGEADRGSGYGKRSNQTLVEYHWLIFCLVPHSVRVMARHGYKSWGRRPPTGAGPKAQ